MSAACASGNYALAQARHWLELGWVDVCLAGACDMAVTPMSLAGFGNLRALSRRNDEPQAASRPFDRDRDGFVMGEGGAMFVLEPARSARRRGARVYAEVAGCGASSDAYNMVIPSPDPEPAIAAMRQALADAGVNPDEVDYVNAHATSTPVGDVAEARVLDGGVRRRRAAGAGQLDQEHDRPSADGGRRRRGAGLPGGDGAPGACRRRSISTTPTRNATCATSPTRRGRQPVRVAVSNSFGFGGSNTCLVLKAA